MGTLYISNDVNNTRLAMWVWASDLKTKANCDAMITYATGKFTDLFVFAIDDSVSPKTWLGTGTIGASNATTIEGKTPWAYVYDLAHAQGIKVHAWLWLGDFNYWGGTTGINTSIPDNATYNDGGRWNHHDGTARDAQVDMIEDFYNNNDMDGLNFNLEATSGNITISDMTEWITELKAVVPDIEFSCCVGGKYGDDTGMKLDTANWLDADLLETIVAMEYYEAIGMVRQYKDSLNLTGKTFFGGMESSPTRVRPSDFKHKWLREIEDGRDGYAIFNWHYINENAGIQTAIGYWLAGTLNSNTVQNSITKVAHVQGTSFTITVNGSDQTTAYADVADHTTEGPLKLHIETAIGSENPAIYYIRLGDTYTYLMIGDNQP